MGSGEEEEFDYETVFPLTQEEFEDLEGLVPTESQGEED